jgi:hypothetical protein
VQSQILSWRVTDLQTFPADRNDYKLLHIICSPGALIAKHDSEHVNNIVWLCCDHPTMCSVVRNVTLSHETRVNVRDVYLQKDFSSLCVC